MNRLTPSKQSQVIAALVEGNSIRATVRMTGASEAGIADHVWSIEEIVKLLDLSNSREVAA
jgi:hypothetical protein